jgi:hypothetical protein
MLAIALALAGADLPMFEPFVGACWRARFSATVNDTHCFEPMYGGAHVRDRHEVNSDGKIVYAGETIYTLEGPDVVFTYVNSTGGIGRGKVSRAGTVLKFVGSIRGAPDKAPQPIDSEWRVVDDDHYEVRSLVKSPSDPNGAPLRFTRVENSPQR